VPVQTIHLQVARPSSAYSLMQDASVDVQTARFETVYREEGRKLWRSLFAFVGDPDVVDDAIAETFAQALARGDEIRDASAWVWRVAFLLANREVQRRKTLTELRDIATYEMPEPAWHVVEALGALTPNQRLAIVLHDYAGRPTDEIASILGCSRATVHVHLSKGRRRLRSLLEDPHD
jgi:RNA polymerase sigma factor (sigma-70 family)